MWLTTPWLLAGLGLLAWPVVAHLMSRRARRVVVFPSVALLAEAAVRQGRGLVVRRWSLLMLRALAVAAVVLAFCGPMVAGGARDGEGVRRGAVVVVLDAGASMGWRLEGAGGATAMTLGKAAADRVLADAEAAGSRAGLVIGGVAAEAVFDRPTRNVAALRTALEGVEATAGTGGLAAALAEGGRLLDQAMRESGGPGRLVVVSDLQASTWSGLGEAGALAGVEAERIEVIDASEGRGRRGNAAVVEVGVEPALARPGETATVSAVVGGSGLAGTRAELWVDGRRVDERGVRFSTGEAAAVSFDLPAGEAGEARAVAVRLMDDGLSADDAGYAVAQTGEPIMGRLLAGSPAEVIDASSPAYYVARALAPRGGAGDRFVIGVSGDGGALAERLRVVAGDATISRNESERLAAWVEAGGGLVMVSDAASDAWLATLGRAGLMPAALRTWRPAELIEAGLIPTAAGDRLLDGLGATAWSALERAGPGGWWSTVNLPGWGEPLALHPDGSIAVGMRSVGGGRVAWVNASVLPSEGGMGRSGAWVALLQAVASWAVGGEEERGERGLAVGAVVSDGPGLRRLDEPGIVRVAESSGGERLIAVNVDPAESAPERWSIERAAAWLSGGGAQEERAGLASTPVSGEGRRDGEPVWGWLLMVGAGLLAAEAMIVGWCRGR